MEKGWSVHVRESAGVETPVCICAKGGAMHVLSCRNPDELCRNMKEEPGRICVGRVGHALKGWGPALRGGGEACVSIT